MLEVTLAPGLLSRNYDGLQNDLEKMDGLFIARGSITDPVDYEMCIRDRGCPETDFALRGHGYFAPDDGFDVRCEDFGGTPEFSFGGDGGLGRDPKLTSGFGDFRGARDDVDAPGGAGCREKCDED